MFSLFDTLEEESKDNQYSYLADDSLLVEGIDFTDPASLLRRQKKIIENISKHQAKSNFDPFRIIRKPVVNWMVILCHGGKFAL